MSKREHLHEIGFVVTICVRGMTRSEIPDILCPMSIVDNFLYGYPKPTLGVFIQFEGRESSSPWSTRFRSRAFPNSYGGRANPARRHSWMWGFEMRCDIGIALVFFGQFRRSLSFNHAQMAATNMGGLVLGEAWSWTGWGSCCSYCCAWNGFFFKAHFPLGMGLQWL